jgi:rare lipoprotein A
MLRSIFSGLAATTLVLSGLAPQEAKAASCTQASHYGVGDGYHGLTTASGERYNAYGLTAAHKSLPFGARVRVTNQANGKSVIVRINDDGPHVYGRSLDLSYGAFSKIASPSQGVASVCYSRV